MNINDAYQMLLICENNIRNYHYMMETSNDPYDKNLYENLLNAETDSYYHLCSQLDNMYPEKEINKSDLREVTVEELAQYDGSNGKPAYVAVNGIVYDVSLEAKWGGGTHFGMYAGKDLTSQFNGCHWGRIETLRNLPQVGLLKLE